MSEIVDLGDLYPVQRDFRVRNRDKQEERYVAREASAGAATAYRNANSRASRYEDGKFVGVDGIADSEVLLVGLCVYRVDDRGGASFHPVGEDVVRTWPDRITRQVYDMIREISPRLVDTPTLEGIDRQIARLTKQREDILLEQRRARGEEKPDPNAPAPATAGSFDSAKL